MANTLWFYGNYNRESWQNGYAVLNLKQGRKGDGVSFYKGKLVIFNTRNTYMPTPTTGVALVFIVQGYALEEKANCYVCHEAYFADSYNALMQQVNAYWDKVEAHDHEREIAYQNALARKAELFDMLGKPEFHEDSTSKFSHHWVVTVWNEKFDPALFQKDYLGYHPAGYGHRSWVDDDGNCHITCSLSCD